MSTIVKPAKMEDFLQSGYTAQERYEQLRSQWFSPNNVGIFNLVRMPWGRRLLHFGLLGLRDEDLTGGAWFSASQLADNEIRCMRVFLSTDDGDVRMREAYRCILESLILESLETAEGFG